MQDLGLVIHRFQSVTHLHGVCACGIYRYMDVYVYVREIEGGDREWWEVKR